MRAGQESPEGSRSVLVLSKITEILGAFSMAHPENTVAELQRATGMPSSTVQRLVASMVAEGMLERHEDRLRIGVNMVYWAAPAARRVKLLDLAQPVLQEIRDETGETASLFREEHGVRVCVAMAETHHGLRQEMHVGKILPLHVGSPGRVILAWRADVAEHVLGAPLPALTDETITDPDVLRAELRATRARGFAMTSGERDEAAAGVSAPVFGAPDELVAALAIIGPTARLTSERRAGLVDVLVAQADRLSRSLGGRRPEA